MIYILCPYGNATGGTELLHQLGYTLNRLSYEVGIYYYGESKGDEPACNPAFEKYKVTRVRSIEDISNSLVIYPEMLVATVLSDRDKYRYVRRIIWWMSVDNAHVDENILMRLQEDKSLIHLCQSYYALDYVENTIGVEKANYYYLSDYISHNFLNINVNDSARTNLVLFNPRKGYERTSRLIQNSNAGISWKAISGLRPEDVPLVLRTAKVYIDFGNHPGKDRFPREAVSCGCRIITGLRGAAKYQQDVDIPIECKFDDDEDDSVILKKIYQLAGQYEDTEGLYQNYLNKIKEEFHIFETDVLKVFSRLLSDTRLEYAKEMKSKEIMLKENILQNIAEGDLKDGYFNLILYRTLEFTINDEFLIIEAYIRTMAREYQVVEYLTTCILNNDANNYEASIVRAEAIVASMSTGIEPVKLNQVQKDIENAITNSLGTADERFICERAKECLRKVNI